AVRDDADDVFRLVLSLTLSVLKARQGSILLVDRDNSELFIKEAIGLDEEIVRTFRTKLGQGISGWVAKQRAPLLIPDIEKDPRFRKLSDPKYETHSLLCAPLVKKNRVLGVVNINNKVDGSSFSREELALLTALADQMAIIVENALLLRESAEKANDLREANAKLTQANREKKDFLARVSHELRTPLNAIKGAVHYLKNASESIPAGRLQEFLGIIDHDSGRLSQMISDLLDYARLEDEEIVLSKTPLLLGKLVEEALLHVRGQAHAKEIQIKTRIPSRAGKVPADHDRILRLLADLLSNLIHFARPRSTIHASLMENRPTQVIQIACDGCDIPEDDIGHIFDPFQLRVDIEPRVRYNPWPGGLATLALVIPLQMTLIPVLRLFAALGLVGTFPAVWLAHTGYGLPFAIYLLRNFMGALPRDLMESASIDGASPLTVFFRLILPLSVPA
ncbi:MAG: GAF domain-containing protein, partial [Nitrospirae bacterium]|nr:GAF domain-containing protein [Nitrospirota bacterium]